MRNADKVRVGDNVRARPTISNVYGAVGNAEEWEGVVIYVHPRGRFFTARFDLPGGSLVESFPLGGEPCGGDMEG